MKIDFFNNLLYVFSKLIKIINLIKYILKYQDRMKYYYNPLSYPYYKEIRKFKFVTQKNLKPL